MQYMSNDYNCCNSHFKNIQIKYSENLLKMEFFIMLKENRFDKKSICCREIVEGVKGRKSKCILKTFFN